MMKTFNEIVGENIKRIRKARNITQKQLAYKILYSTSSINNWEHGNYAPSSYYILYLSKVLNCTTDELLKREEDYNNGNG